MNKTRRILIGIATVASLGMAAAAIAQTPPGPGYGPPPGFQPGHRMGAGAGMPGPGMGMPNFDIAAMAEARLTRSKAALKITPDQEAAWGAFAAIVKQQAESMKAVRAAAIAEAKTAVPERMAQHILIAQQHVDNMKALQPKLADLYNVLTAEQKAVADKLIGRMHRRHRGPGF